DQWRSSLPSIAGNPDYTATVNTSNYERIVGLVDDAVAKGAHKRDAAPAGERLPDALTRKIAPTLLTGVTPEMDIDSDEVFGPVLTVFRYKSVDEAIRYINDRPARWSCTGTARRTTASRWSPTAPAPATSTATTSASAWSPPPSRSAASARPAWAPTTASTASGRSRTSGPWPCTRSTSPPPSAWPRRSGRTRRSRPGSTPAR